jgi:calreticulin
LTSGKFYGDKEKDQGIQTSQDAKFYAVSASFDEFSNEGKDLVIQFSVKHEQNIDCGGGYVKVMPTTDAAQVDGDSKYYVMFGPDICGATKKIHFIFHYKGKNLLWKKEPRCETDTFSHVYTAIIKPDGTYEVLVDQVKKESGTLEEDWDFLKPKTIPDPNDKKPKDWVDEAEMADPEDKKPDDWDDEPEQIADPEATQPDDWDEEEDGKWEAPMISNPKFKGEWKAKMIPNPEYKGVWKPKEIDNPEYEADDNLGKYTDVGSVAFDLWQVKSGSIFDNVIITDSLDEAKDFYKETNGATKDGEKKMQEEKEAEERKKEEEERKKREEEEKKSASEDEDDVDEEEEDDEEEDDKKDEL